MLLMPNFELSGKVGKSVEIKANFEPFWQLNCSKFRIKQCQGPQCYQSRKGN